MEFNIEKDKLIKALQKVTDIIGSRSTLPGLANVLIEAKDGTLYFTTTDLEISITALCDAEVISEGKTTMPAKKLFLLSNKFNGEKVYFKCNENNHAEIICGTSNVKLLGLGTEDFPVPSEFPVTKTLKFKEADFSRMISQISYAVSLDDTRKVLHGVYCSKKDNSVTMVATDGKRLAMVEKIPQNSEGEDGDNIIPLKTANEVKRLFNGDGDIEIKFGEKQLMLSNNNVTIFSKLIEGNYPNYRQVIPASFNNVIEVSTAEMLNKLDLVSAALSDSSSFVVISFDKKIMNFEGSSSGIGEVKDYMATDYDGEKMDVSFNPVFLADPLKHSDSDKIMIKFNDGFSPVGIEGKDGFLYVIMPMRNR
ncbi:MAG: DNA polymerase III subunit beta [Victivallaceae bacterium]|nr:DNA polymerase III subunit beta [Victivallaceae bacterium]